ncbi:MAG: methyl-accepting chemotaxis protein [Roseburia sp.]
MEGKLEEAERKLEAQSIKERIAYYVIITIAVVVVVFVLVLGGLATSIIMSRTNENREKQVQVLEEQTLDWFDQQITYVNMITSTIEHYDMTANEDMDVEAYLADCIEQNDTVYDYYIGLEDKTCFFGGDWKPAPGEYDPTSRSWYQDTVAANALCVSEAYVDVDSGRIVITISKPLYRNDQIIGVFAADIFIDELIELADGLHEGTSGYAVLVDKAGTVLTHKNPKYLPTVDENGEEILTNYADAGISSKLVGSDDVVRKNGGAYVYTAQSLSDIGLTVIVADTFWHCYGGVIIFYIGCLILLVLSVVSVMNSMKKLLPPIFRPLKELTTVAENMSNGVLEYQASYRNKDEIGEVCVAIEKSNAAIRSYITDVDEKLQAMADGNFTVQVDMDYIGDFSSLKISINKIAESLRETMRVISDAADAVHGSAENVAGGATNLAEDVMDVTRLVDDVDHQVNSVKNKFDMSYAQATTSMQLSETAQSNLDMGYKRLQELLQAMDKIAVQSQRIGEIIEIINDIATQTNLLALNASIEAARAGEAGKGFSVVANSVRELAARTAEAAANTTNLIRESTAAVDEGSQLVKQVTADMQEVVEKTEDVNNHVQEIADSIRQETEIIDAVTKNFMNMEDFTTNTSATSEECVALSNELYEQVDRMHSILARFKL